MRLVLEKVDGRLWTIEADGFHSGKDEGGDLANEEALWVVAQFINKFAAPVPWLKRDEEWSAFKQKREAQRAALNYGDPLDPRFSKEPK